MNDNILEKITEARAKAPQTVSLKKLEAQAARRKAPLDFSACFRGEGIHVIAELKKASPSKGLIREDFPVVSLAKELESAGAAALSILTEPDCFLGKLNFIRDVRPKVRIPILRKDFISNEYQILEARAAGADAILLIAAVLDAKKFRELFTFASSLGLSVLCEAHTRKEIDMLVDGGAKIIGVNARDLTNFSLSLDVTMENLKHIPEGIIKIAESGIQNAFHIKDLREAGADGFLIGETLMRAEHPGEKLKELLG